MWSCVWESSLALDEQEQQGSKGKRQEWMHRGDFVTDPQCRSTFLQAFPFPGTGKCHPFSCWGDVAYFCQRNDKPLSLQTSAPIILSQPEVTERQGCGNSLQDTAAPQGCGIPVSSWCLMSLIFGTLSALITLPERQPFSQIACWDAECLENQDQTPEILSQLSARCAQYLVCALEVTNCLQMCRRADFQVISRCTNFTSQEWLQLSGQDMC